jgi:hypothetical protein
MHNTDLNRRALLRLLGGCTAAGLAGCAAEESPRDGIVRLLDLSGDERQWVDTLSDSEQRELHALLSGSDPAGPRAVRLIQKMIGRRSRLFAFVGYPQVPDRRNLCNGVIRE